MKGFVVRLLLPIFVCGVCLYSYIDKQNALTRLKIAIPTLAKEIRALHEENVRLHYEIDLFESPEHLLELAKSCAFSHLKHPLVKEILTVKEGIALQPGSPQEEEKAFLARSESFFRPKLPLATK